MTSSIRHHCVALLSNRWELQVIFRSLVHLDGPNLSIGVRRRAIRQLAVVPGIVLLYFDLSSLGSFSTHAFRHSGARNLFPFGTDSQRRRDVTGRFLSPGQLLIAALELD